MIFVGQISMFRRASCDTALDSSIGNLCESLLSKFTFAAALGRCLCLVGDTEVTHVNLSSHPRQEFWWTKPQCSEGKLVWGGFVLTTNLWVKYISFKNFLLLSCFLYNRYVLHSNFYRGILAGVRFENLKFGVSKNLILSISSNGENAC